MLRWIGVALLIVVGLLGVALVTLASPIGHGIVAGLIERYGSTGGLTVAVDGVGGWPPFTLSAEKIAVADADGPVATIDNIAMDVGIFGLLGGTIALDALTAEKVAILRKPNLPASNDSGGALVAFTARQFSIARLDLSEAVAGRSTALSLNGSAATSRAGDIAADVRAARIDGVAGTLDAQINRAGDDDWFAAEIAVKEAADGLLVGLIGRPAGPAYALSVKAGPVNGAMRGTISLSSSGAAQFAGQFAVSSEADTSRIMARGSGDLAELLPATYADLLAGAIDIALDADLTGNTAGARPDLSIRQGTFRTASVNGEVSGRVGADHADLKLALDIANPSDKLLSLPLANMQATIESASLRGTVAPANGNARLDLVGRVVGLSIDGVTIPGTGFSAAIENSVQNPLSGDMPFAMRLEADAIRTATGTLTATAAAPLLATGEGTFHADTGIAELTADLRAAGGSGAFAGTVSAGEGKGRLTARFADIAPLALVFDRNLAGGVDASAEGTFFGTDGSALDVRAELADFRPGIETLDRLLGGNTTVSANVANSDGTLSVSDLAINGAALQGTGSATIEPTRIDATLAGTISDLSVLADRSSGAATFTATAEGALPYPDLDATTEIAGGSLLDQAIEGASVRVQGAPSETGMSGSLALDGSLAGKPLTGTADFVLSGDNAGIAFPAVDLTIADNRITGALQRAGEGTLSGELAVAAPNLQALAALALSQASGTANARIRFTPDGDRQAIAAAFNARDVSYNGLTAKSASGEVRIGDAFGTPLVDGNATIDSILAGAVRLDRVAANATVEGGATRFDLTAKGPDLDLTGRGELSAASGQRVLRIDQFSGTAFRVPIALAEPATVQLDAAAGPATRAAFSIGAGRVTIEGKASSPLDLRITATGVPASVANGFAPALGAAGAISGNATVTGETSAPRIRWQAVWSGLQVAATRNAGLPPLSLTASGDATKASTAIQGTLSGAGLSLALGGTAPFAGNGLDVTVKGRAPLSLLALRSNREVRLTGNADLDLRVTGASRAPAINGSINLVDATAVDVETGFGVSGASGRIALNGKQASIERISGRLAQGGQIVIAGTADLGSPQLPGRLTIQVTEGRYNDGRMVNTLFNANLALDGPLTGGATLSGNLALGRTEIRLPDRLAGRATAIDVKHVNAEPGFSAPIKPQPAASAGRAGGGSMRLDVDLRSTGAILVRGFGVDSEFGGQLKITNTIANPTAAGAFEMRRGRIEVIGRRFELVSGQLTFSGDLVPVVDFVATAATTSATVQVNVTGRADDPVISFSSNPDMPDEDILSILLFDRQVSRLSPVQAAQLVDAAAQLSGVGGGRGIFASVRDALGVDDLDIRQNESGGATVGIGKRINDNVRLGVEAGSGSESGRVTIDLDLTPELKLRGGAGQGGTGELGLSYEREY